MLLNKKLLKNAMMQFEFPQGEDLANIQQIITNWQIWLKIDNSAKTKEKSIQGDFLRKFFSDILGYASQFDGQPVYQLVQHPKAEVDATEPDGVLGVFGADKKIYRAVIELKGAKTLLDKKQSSRKDYSSPVAQAFSYLFKFDKCDWAIVSNFKEIRLYHKSRSLDFYEKFDILSLNDEIEFQRFYFLLCRQNLVCENRQSVLDELVKNTSEQEEEISKTFYKQFKVIRHNLFVHLIANNPQVERLCLLQKTQKLLDRMIFVFFCEDSYSLLPAGISLDIYKLGKKSRRRSDQRIWDEFREFFQDIDKGRYDIDPPINAYNGGLFAHDELLNSLIIKDVIWDEVIALADYDFNSDLNVNILGHIFEQSLTDLEKIKNNLDAVTTIQQSKRKREGIFYTPEYITRYIVEQAVGQYLDDYPEKLDTIKILDPACGSGAFLNQAHNFLKAQHEIRRVEKITQLKDGETQDTEKHLIDKSILLNNLFGVDLNYESVEITKLALWLKTAKPNKPLQNIDENIKCGNSLIDDVKVAGDKAFNWHQEFSDIMQSGGFDVIIGNPPYLRMQGLKEYFEKEAQYFTKNYQSATLNYDIYVLFLEKAFELINENGCVCFILPHKFLISEFGKGIRAFLAKHQAVELLVHFGSSTVFEEASTYTCIVKLSHKNQNINFLQTTPKELNTSLSYTPISYDDLSDKNWNLANQEITQILTKLKQQPLTVKDVFAKIFVGLQTSLDDVYLIRGKKFGSYIEGYSKALDKMIEIETDFVKPILKGNDIARYKHLKNEYVVIFPYLLDDGKATPMTEEYIKQYFPKGYQYLKDNEVLLRNREKGRFNNNQEWFLFGRSQGITHVEQPKIITPDIAFKSSMSFDTGIFYHGTTLYSFVKHEHIEEDYLFYLAIFNSSLMWFFIKHTSTELRGGYFRFKTKYLEPFPLPKLDSINQQQSLVEKAEKMLELHKELHEISSQSIAFLQARYKLEKITKKLQKFWQLEFNTFLEELLKQKVIYYADQEERLWQWHTEKQTTLVTLEKQIDALDRQIDNEVYQLYDLTNDEINIIENDK
jgi:type I restriction-modification system DNA methylase subunit